MAAQIDPFVPTLQKRREVEELIPLRRAELETELRESRVEDLLEVSQSSPLLGDRECST
ncbi:MAG TPA: hypothetical protein VMS55_19580 [Myxococcota bacterium]|nr:hypothetical protein [Myxococcota bacterium]